MTRRVGWASLALGLALALVAGGYKYVGDGEPPFVVLMAFCAAILVGLLALLTSTILRLARGDLRIRPMDAMKKFVWFFSLLIVLRLLIWLIFPDMERDLTKILLWSAAFASGYSLYTTAYRRAA